MKLGIMVNYFESIKNQLLRFQNLGLERMENGTLLIGRALHIAKAAWLNKIYSVLTEHDLVELEKELKMTIPPEYAYFLSNYSNGLNMFVAKFYLYGYRKEIGRTADASRQPFSLLIPNVDERPKNAKGYFFFIGGYKWDGSKLYIDRNTGRVHYCARWDSTSLYEWESFENMIVSEVIRINSLFDDEGKIKDENLYTTPVEIK